MESIVKRTVEPCKKALKDADVAQKDVGEVLLVGGMSRYVALMTTDDRKVYH